MVDKQTKPTAGLPWACVFQWGRGQLRTKRSPELLPPSNRDPKGHRSVNKPVIAGRRRRLAKRKFRVFAVERGQRRALREHLPEARQMLPQHILQRRRVQVVVVLETSAAAPRRRVCGAS